MIDNNFTVTSEMFGINGQENLFQQILADRTSPLTINKLGWSIYNIQQCHCICEN